MLPISLRNTFLFKYFDQLETVIIANVKLEKATNSKFSLPRTGLRDGSECITKPCGRSDCINKFAWPGTTEFTIGRNWFDI